MNDNQPPTTPGTVPITPVAPQVAPASQPQPPVAPPQVPESPKKAKFDIKKVLIIVGAILVVIVLGFAIYKFVIPRLGGKNKEVTLTWWGLWEDEAIVAPIIAEYEASNPGVKITYTKESKQQYRERLTSALARGEGPDIFEFHNSWVPMFRKNLAPLPDSVMSVADYASAFYPVVLSDLSTSAGIVGVPMGVDTLNLFINDSLFREFGLSAPKTWDEFRDSAKRLTIINDKGVITQSGVALGRVENVDHWPEILALMMLQSGVDLKNPVGELAEKSLVYFTLFSKSDGVWDETLPESTTAFANGKLAMYFGPSWRALDITAANPALEYSVVPVPQLPKGEGETFPDVTYATYWVEGVNPQGISTLEAWKFLAFLTQKDTLQKLYQNEAKQRGFGEAYPRVDMKTLLADAPINSAVVSQIENAKSWYLYSRTFDGPTGLNSQLASYFEDAINTVLNGSAATKALETAAQGVSQVLTNYAITK